MSFVLLFVFLGAQEKLPRFREEVIETQSGGAGYNSCVVDLNADGRPDVVLVTQRKDQVIWYENPAGQGRGAGWKKHLISSDIALPEPIVPFDVDGDGRPELIVGGNFAMANTTEPCPIWLLRRPPDPSTPWTPIKIDQEPSAHRLALVGREGKKELVVSCLMGRGAKAPDWSGPGAPLYLLRATADPFRDPWRREAISDALHRVHGITAFDWEGKGEDVLLAAAFEGVHVLRRRTDRWELAERIGQSPGASEIRVLRLPGGTRALASVEPWHGNQVALYTGGPGAWKRRVILDRYKVGHGIVPVDFSGNGVDSLLLGFRGAKGEGGHAVVLMHPLDASGENWETAVLDDKDMEADAVHAVDLDGDGRIDIVATGKGTNIKIYWNEGK
jgi:hypothetical protein